MSGLKFGVAMAFLGVVAVGSVARAQNEHFVGDPTVRCSGSSLQISFKVAGLGQGEFVTVTADDDALVQCINRGDNPPPGQREEVFASGDFGPASKSGNIRGTLSLTPQGDCPDRMTQRVTYTNITVETQSGDTVFLGGPYVCEG